MVKTKTVAIILKILANFIVHRNFGNYFLVRTNLRYLRYILYIGEMDNPNSVYWVVILQASFSPENSTGWIQLEY